MMGNLVAVTGFETWLKVFKWTQGPAPVPGGLCSSGTGPQGRTSPSVGGLGLGWLSCSVGKGCWTGTSNDHLHHHCGCTWLCPGEGGTGAMLGLQGSSSQWSLRAISSFN